MQGEMPTAKFSMAEADMSKWDTVIAVLQRKLDHVQKLSHKKDLLLFQRCVYYPFNKHNKFQNDRTKVMFTQW